METKARASVKTFGKYILWFAVSAGLYEAVAQLGNVDIPVYYIPVAAAVLKAVATWAATQAEGNKP